MEVCSSMLRYHSDVVVIGAGIAGVTAALELLDRGRRTLLIDRDVEENMGALAKESFGGIWFAGTRLQRRYGIRDGAELGLKDWNAFAEFRPEDHWPRAWARAYVERANEEIFDWLTRIGVEFMPMPLWVERGLHTPGNSVPRWHIVWGTGHELATVLNRRLLSHPRRDLLELRFGHRVETLLITNGTVTGCRGSMEGANAEWRVGGDRGRRHQW
jgi:predicted oxidoreductase